MSTNSSLKTENNAGEWIHAGAAIVLVLPTESIHTKNCMGPRKPTKNPEKIFNAQEVLIS